MFSVGTCCNMFSQTQSVFTPNQTRLNHGTVSLQCKNTVLDGLDQWQEVEAGRHQPINNRRRKRLFLCTHVQQQFVYNRLRWRVLYLL